MRKSAVYIIAIVSIFSIVIGYNYYFENKDSIQEDEKNFKMEYESLNNKINKKNNEKYISVEIPTDNVVKYSTYDEISLIVQQGSGIVFLCNSKDFYCRNVVSTLMEAVKETMYDSVYYLDISQDREVVSVKDDKVIITKKGSKKYYKLVNILNDYLDYYVVYDSDGTSINSNIKRIEYPLVLFIQDGEVKSHVGWDYKEVDNNTELDDRSKGELLLKYIDGINMINGSVIDENS